tara:strand:+ start:501 stop:734 length:234 start_codon:yes stop_codon:yes gene_type:complete
MKSKKEIFESTVKNTRFEQLSASSDIGQGIIMGYTQCQEDMADKDKWTFDEILDACYPTLGRGSDWADIVKRLREQY